MGFIGLLAPSEFVNALKPTGNHPVRSHARSLIVLISWPSPAKSVTFPLVTARLTACQSNSSVQHATASGRVRARGTRDVDMLLPFPNGVIIGDVRGHSARLAISGHMMLLRKKNERDIHEWGPRPPLPPRSFMA